MNAIGNSNRPVFIDAKGVPQECNENPKNATLVGTDANGALVAKTASSANQSKSSETWSFETIGGSTVSKTVVTSVTLASSVLTGVQ